MDTYDINYEDGAQDEYAKLLEALDALHEAPGRCVLVVDDEPTVRRMVSRSMKSLDKSLTVHEAENGQDALAVLNGLREAGDASRCRAGYENRYSV